MEPGIKPKEAIGTIDPEREISGEIKNAHAAGDGAMERGDIKTDLADQEILEPKDQDGIPY